MSVRAAERSFNYDAQPARILFGRGTLAQAGAEVKRLGGSRPLVLSTAFQAEDAQRLAKDIGGIAFTEAAMHTPTDVTAKAVAVAKDGKADSIVAFGGGSTTGLGKAVAVRLDLPHLAIATTYAGSEVTPILGETTRDEGGNGVKTTRRDPAILPDAVIYDPDLTLGLPVAMSVTSGMNAVAHAIEALYAEDRNPVASMMAAEGIRALRDALTVIVDEPRDTEARADALYGAWLCGTVLGQVGMALHHKLAHTLGGSFDLPHAETHTVLLPHTAAFNEQAVPDLLAPAAALFGGSLGRGLHAFATRLGAPTTLASLGLHEGDLDRAADLAVAKPYPNPRPLERAGIRDLLQRAFDGAPPN